MRHCEERGTSDAAIQKIMKTEKLKNIKQKCKNCASCDLHKTRNNIVFADGNPETASIVLIGEAPGQNEDLQGIPFVGRAGKFLNEFLEKSGISREKDLYIINTVKCRPPKNRVPTDKEKEACRHFLISQIEIINPKIILLCGATALKSFVKTKTPISQIRGEVFEISLSPSPKFLTLVPRVEISPSPIKGEGNSKKYQAMPIFHPSYLLRNHSDAPDSPRGLMLKDLKKVKSFF